MKARFFLFVALVSAVTLLIGCGSGGGGGQATNAAGAGVAQSFGSVRGNIGGNGAIEGIPVFLVAAGSSVPPQSTSGSVRGDVSGQYYSSVTLPGGAFQFTSVVPGTYNLIAQKDRFTGGILQNIVVTKDIAPVNLTLMLTPTGQVSGTVSVPSSVSASGIVAYVLGTSYSAFTDGTGNYTIIGVPVGTYTVGFNGSGLLSSVVNSVFVAPGAATTIPMQSLAINTAFFDPNAPGGVAVASQYATLFTTPVTYVAENASFPVVFSHYTHVSQYKENCFDCHTNSTDTWPLAPGATLSNVKSVRGTVRAMVALKSMAMTQMYAGKYCGKCHNGGVAFDSKTNCGKCHVALSSNGPAVLFASSNTPFSHAAHVDSFKLTCNACHQNNNPWPMSYKDPAYAMASISAGLGCGICHKSGGSAFDCNLGDSCARCHNDPHTVVRASDVGYDACNGCHAAIVTEFDLTLHGAGADGKSGNTKWFNQRAQIQSGRRCTECHTNEGIPLRQHNTDATFNAALMANSEAGGHAMTCQTCHYPNLQVEGARDNDDRLRENGDILCGSCHHYRFGYSKFPTTPAVFPTNQVQGVYTFVDQTSDLLTISPSLPVALATVFGLNPMTIASPSGNASAVAALVATQTINLNNIINAVWYATHDSADQYELVHGNQYNGSSGGLVGPFLRFSRDISSGSGVLLTYGDAGWGKSQKACITCHFANRDYKTTFGHSFKATPAADADAKEASLTASLELLRVKLKATGGTGSPAYVRTSATAAIGADYTKLVTLGVPQWARIIYLGAYWNYALLSDINGLKTLAVHNYEFARDLINNTNLILDQIKASPKITGVTWWY
ncbi:MAG: hypothetical protein HQM09_14185 [Candidatus Riflebacteria bacterium]|nr:hypothetical protein [Candidatus Riflebacteria bacterium]